MSDRLVVVAAFNTPIEAYAAKNLLEANEVPAFLADGDTVGDLWHLGPEMGGIKLQVDAENLERAREILASVDARPSPEADASAAGQWTCSRCGESSPADFDTCWSCGASRDGQADPAFETAEATPPADSEIAADTKATWALWLAVVGIAIVPPLLNLLSAVILLGLISPREDRGEGFQRKVSIAWAIDLLVCAGVVILFQQGYIGNPLRALFYWTRTQV